MNVVRLSPDCLVVLFYRKHDILQPNGIRKGERMENDAGKNK